MNTSINENAVFNQALSLNHVTVKRINGDGGKKRPLFWALFGSLIFFFFFLFLSKDIYTDFKISQNSVQVNAKVKGSCDSVLLFFTKCDVNIYFNKQLHEKTVFFFDVTAMLTDSYEAIPVVNFDDFSELSLQLAIDKLPSRIILNLLILIIAVTSLVAVIKGFIKIKISNVLIKKMNEGELKFALYEFDQAVWKKKKAIIYELTIDGKNMVIDFGRTLNINDAPLFVKYHNQIYALAVMNSITHHFMIVDHGLNRFKLNNTSKLDYLNAINSLGEMKMKEYYNFPVLELNQD